MHFIDTHCHLNFNAFRGGFLDVARRAREVGVEKIIIPGSNVENSLSAVEMVKKLNKEFGKSFAFAGIGIHPVHVDELEKFSQIEKLAGEVIAIGECGLDFFHDKEKKTLVVQKELFVKHLNLAVKNNLPLICHNRDADKEMSEILEICAKLPKIVFHCFSSNWEFAEYILGKGFYLSFTGNITYGNKTLKKVIERTPPERIMIETDAPYLVPEPLRSQGVKPNEPAYVVEVAKKIAEIKDLSLEKVASATTKNAKDFFKI